MARKSKRAHRRHGPPAKNAGAKSVQAAATAAVDIGASVPTEPSRVEARPYAMRPASGLWKRASAEHDPAPSLEEAVPESALVSVARLLARHHVPTRIALACAFLGVAAPMCVVRFVPFVDYPQHLGQIAALANIGDPRFSSFYDLALAKSQYYSFYLPAVLLAKVVGAPVATRAMAVAAVAGLPLAVAAYLAAHKRAVLPAALSALVALNLQTFWGFLNFALGIIAGLLGLAAHARLVEKPGWRRTAILGAAALVCFYAHAYAYAWFVGGCALQTLFLVPRVGWRQALGSVWRSALAGVPSLVAALVWILASGVLQHGEVGARVDLSRELESSTMSFTPPLEVLGNWMGPSFGFYRDGSGKDLGKLFVVACGLLLLLRIGRWVVVSRRSASIPETRRRPSRTSFAPEAVLAFSTAIFLFGPEGYKLVHEINTRFVVITLALLPVLAPVALGPRLKVACSTLFVGLLGYAAVVHTQHFRKLDAEMGDIDEALDHAAPGKRLLGLVFDPDSAVSSLRPFLHGHLYYQADVGGMSAWSFVELAHSPLTLRPGTAPPPFPWGWEWNPEWFSWARWGPSFDYILVRTPEGRPAPWPLRSQLGGRTRLAYDGLRWKLYERLPAPARPNGEIADPGPDELAVQDSAIGAGEAARMGDEVSVAYSGTLMDGTPAFNSAAGKSHMTLQLGGKHAVKGLDHGLLGMRVGGKRNLVLPQWLAFGGDGLEPNVPPGAGLILDVELLSVQHP